LRRDGILCDKADPEFFASCCPQLLRTANGRRPLLGSRLRSMARWRMFADHYPQRRRRQLLKGTAGMAERLLGQPETTAVDAKRSFFLQSTRRIFSQVDLFLSPSLYLRQRFVACGLAPERMRHVRYGMKHFTQQNHRPSADGRLRFDYIGAFHAHKDIGVLLEALAGLGDLASLHLHSSSFGSPVSEAHLRKLTSQPGHGDVVHGRYDNARLDELLAGLDAVIMPSMWFENEPLMIQEAQIAGVPVITANQGGMAELVRDRIGWAPFPAWRPP
jgi:glycosyltransferase involved in cell wall biosynthesis